MTHKKIAVCACDGRGGFSSTNAAALSKVDGVVPSSGVCRGLSTLNIDPNEALIVGCTQEEDVLASLLGQHQAPIQFVNLKRNQQINKSSTEFAASLVAQAAFEGDYAADAVPSVAFKSTGKVAVLADEQCFTQAFVSAATALEIDLIVADAGSISLSAERKLNVLAARAVDVKGYLGAFQVAVERTNPVDTELCTQCGACVEACPTQSINAQNFTIDLNACDSNKACVKACGQFNAIRFDDLKELNTRDYDMVIDLRAKSAFSNVQAPLGYWHTGPSLELVVSALLEATQTVGEFEKPKFFAYNQSICAHSRSGVQGCSSCIDTCSTKAIKSNGDGIKVDPHLCLGCGACTSVCPTGAIQYAYTPSQSFLAASRTALKAYSKAGGVNPTVALHSAEAFDQVAFRALKSTAPVTHGIVPLEIHHSASTGPDTWLTLLAYGAKRVSVVLSPSEFEYYGQALQSQAQWANEVLSVLGFGARIQILVSSNCMEAFASAPEASSWQAAAFMPSGDKRTRLEFALEYLAGLKQYQDVIPLSAPAPFGKVEVDTSKCTLCMSCTGACPSSALIDNPLEPQLRFIERNCVQCGLCVETCPEDAISLVTQLSLSPEAKQKRVLNQSQPFYCTKCAKPFGTKHMIENMLNKLAGHSMFEANSKRLTMCGDCRVTDMFEDKNEMTIFEVKR